MKTEEVLGKNVIISLGSLSFRQFVRSDDPDLTYKEKINKLADLHPLMKLIRDGDKLEIDIYTKSYASGSYTREDTITNQEMCNEVAQYFDDNECDSRIDIIRILDIYNEYEEESEKDKQ